jgi:hypothetical protein
MIAETHDRVRKRLCNVAGSGTFVLGWRSAVESSLQPRKNQKSSNENEKENNAQPQTGLLLIFCGLGHFIACLDGVIQTRTNVAIDPIDDCALRCHDLRKVRKDVANHSRALRKLSDLLFGFGVDLSLLHILAWKHTGNVNDLVDRFYHWPLFVARGERLLCHPEVRRELVVRILKSSPQIMDHNHSVWMRT